MNVSCEYCGNEFVRETGRYNEAIKMGWKQFCSPYCLSMSRKTRIDGLCSNPLCRKPFTRIISQAHRSKLIFCSLSCSAAYYNAIRQNSVPLRRCQRVGCNNFIHTTNQKIHFCGGTCSRLFRQGLTSYTPESTIAQIQSFVTKNKRIPIRNELGYLNRLARRFFGTWNKAIEAAGFSPNPVRFAKHYVALDGHKCDSLAERIVDDWLYRRHINHLIHVAYPWKNGMSADFVVGRYYIELFGLRGEHKRYDELREQKMTLAKHANINIVELSLHDVYRNGLAQKLSILDEHLHRPS